ncbi:helix-turn-helix domain-containing protein [Vagococcus lutrae]|uniref:helix-turn-helix domain-containing protein n=1 Tax=Vagococcus lutrae TaxID=81947 RepID=UPI00288E9F0E|nr:helix-turn-helix transcriptional regulator [Vagococcus lutrae]MDT2844676.1 helix-turn-helix transcriptional regulator [Vagococcus lutrae]
MKNKIKYSIEEKGISVRQLSIDLDMDYPTAHALVNRKDLSATKLGTINDIAKYLNVDIKNLYMEEENMMNELIEIAKKELNKEMEKVGYIDNSDSTDRFVDTLVAEYVERSFDEDEADDAKEELTEALIDYLDEAYEKAGEVDEAGNYKGCYYVNEKGLAKWEKFFEE